MAQEEKPQRPAQEQAKAEAAAKEGKPTTTTAPDHERREERTRQRTAPAARPEPTTERHQTPPEESKDTINTPKEEKRRRSRRPPKAGSQEKQQSLTNIISNFDIFSRNKIYLFLIYLARKLQSSLGNAASRSSETTCLGRVRTPLFLPSPLRYPLAEPGCPHHCRQSEGVKVESA